MTTDSVPVLVYTDSSARDPFDAEPFKWGAKVPHYSTIDLEPTFEASSTRITGSTFKSWEDKEAMTLAEAMDIPHFPDLGQGVERTSEPIQQSIGAEEQELLDAVTKDKLRELLDAPMGMVRFEEWVQEEGQAGSSTLLRYYKDVRAQTALIQQVMSISQGLDLTYFQNPSGGFKGLTTNPAQCLPALSSAMLAMNTAEDEVLGRLYTREFKRFISGKLTEQASACLGQFADLADRGNLGEIYCLADPRERDTPLVYVSDGFCELSEYPRSRLIGRNCRFLQGPGTDREAVRLLKEALQAGKEHTSLLLNYSRTGRPFWNLLTMIPLRNAAGEIEYYLGAQINVNRALTSRATFEALTGMSEEGRGRSSVDVPRIQFSEDVLSAAEKQAKAPAVLRQIMTPQLSTSPTLAVPESPVLPVAPSHPPSGKMQRWYSDLRTRKSISGLKTVLSSDNIHPDSTDEVRPILQQVDSSVKEHMATFASVYSKIIVFNAGNRKITHITPDLLSFLGYSTKKDKDRLSPPMIGLDVLTLLADASPAVTKVTRQTVAKSISDRTPHSFFTGLKMYDARQNLVQSVAQPGVEVTASGAPFTRGLLHLTPVKDIKDVVIKYILVVG